MELNNLADNPAFARELAAMVAFYESCQKTAVDDIGLSKKSDPASDPFLRPDQAWGPYVDSKLCKW